MGKLLKTFGIAFAIMVVTFLVVGFNLSSEYNVERMTKINAPQGLIFNQIQSFQSWQAWSPWAKTDSTMQVSFSGLEKGEGAVMSWTSELASNGKQTIVKTKDSSEVHIELDFGNAGKANALFLIEPLEQGMKVTWKFYGDIGSDIFGRYFNLLLDPMMGPLFETGLADLKDVAEQMVRVEKANPKDLAPSDSISTTITKAVEDSLK